MKFVENPKVNDEVVKIVKTLKEEIIFNFHPKSIILSGSFGRGEATAFEENGKLKFLSDCEITIIPYKYVFSRNKIDEFELNFYERTGLKVGVWGATHSFFLITPFITKKLKPTIWNYDLKYGSQVIYGKDYLEKIPNFKPGDIPLWEGIRLLFNRMAESLEHFSFEKPTEEMVFWTDKIVLACQDALLLSLGKYHYSYRIRSEMFQNLFLEHFSELEDKNPNFLDLAIEATERKLNMTKDVNNPIEYWFDTAKICDKVFRYVIKKDMGFTFQNYSEFQEKYLKHPNIKHKYYRGLSASPYYQNLWSVARMLTNSHNFFPPKIITKIGTPWTHIIHSSILLVYFSLSRNGYIDKSQLKQVRKNISFFKKLNQPNKYIFEEWKYLKNQTFKLWYHTCY